MFAQSQECSGAASAGAVAFEAGGTCWGKCAYMVDRARQGMSAHCVVLLRARDLDVRVGQLLAPVGQVARDARDGEQHREELRREAHRAVHQACAGGAGSGSARQNKKELVHS